MKIELKIGKDENGSPIHELYIDNSNDVNIFDLGECPEDARIGRDLIDGNDIINYISMGFDAARKGEKLEISFTNLEGDF